MSLPLEISCQEVHQWQSKGHDFWLIDCREPAEQQLVALVGAKLLPMSRLPELPQELVGQTEKELVIFCHHGFRSLQMTQWLRSQGYSQAQSMAGGIDAWAREIAPEMKRY